MHRKGIMQTLFLMVALLMTADLCFTGHVRSDEAKIPLSESPCSFHGDLNPSLGAVSTSASGVTVDYMLYDHYGGTWCDAEKTKDNTDDDLLCWAAAASNVLEWTGWGFVVHSSEGAITNCDEMFAHFQAHWTDEAGLPNIGWHWWFDGTVETSPPWAVVDVPGGGDFWTPPYTFSDYSHAYIGSDTLEYIDEYMSKGWGVALAIYDGGHAITCWGFRYDSSVDKTTNPHDYYKGIWVTDSDDDDQFVGPGRSAPDSLKYFDVWFNSTGGFWQLPNYYDGRWHISKVYGLEPLIPVPIDIKPGDDRNSINPSNKGLISVAILNDASWTPYYIDLALVDPSSTAFGPNKASPVFWHYEDVDLDGDIDLILFFKVQETGITKADNSATLTANLLDGRQITGVDYISIAPRKGI